MRRTSTLRTQHTLASLPSTVFWARKLTADCLNRWNALYIRDDAELMVSELVTNAITASEAVKASVPVTAGPPLRDVQCVRFQLTLEPRRLIIEVWDINPDPPAVKAHSLDGESGRGLPIISAVSQRWGWYSGMFGHEYPGKVVWCELPA